MARWKRIEQVREESGFYLYHAKNRKDKSTFRTMVNFDKALNASVASSFEIKIILENQIRWLKQNPISRSRNKS